MLADPGRRSNGSDFVSVDKNCLVSQKLACTGINQSGCFDQDQFFCCGSGGCQIGGYDQRQNQESSVDHHFSEKYRVRLSSMQKAQPNCVQLKIGNKEVDRSKADFTD